MSDCWREQRAGDGWRITVIPRRDAPLLMWLLVAPFDAFVIYGALHENPHHPSPAPLYWAFVLGGVVLTCLAVSNSWGRTVLRVGPDELRKTNLPCGSAASDAPCSPSRASCPNGTRSPPQERRGMACGAVHVVSFTGERRRLLHFEEAQDVERAVERLSAMLRELRPTEPIEPYR